jgi:glycosyltransferase involved in cell wall biosynthesis
MAQLVWIMMASGSEEPALTLLSVVIPARDEEGCIASTVEHLHLELRLNHVPHEILVVDDGSSDRTADIVRELGSRVPEARLVTNGPPHGFGRAINCGLQNMRGDAVVIMMADESDDCRDVVRYWNKLNEGWDAVFGSRFMRGGGVIDYPWLKLRINRMANRGLPASSIGSFQSNGGSSPQNNHSRIFLGDDADHMAQSADRRSQTENPGDGQPVPFHLSLSLAGEVLESRGLQENHLSTGLIIMGGILARKALTRPSCSVATRQDELCRSAGSGR